MNDLIDLTEPEPLNSIDYLRSIYRDPMQPTSVRMRAAIAALPFEAPKLAVIANLSTKDFADRLEAQIKYRTMIEATPGFRRRV
jgi:hypothetical protein